MSPAAAILIRRDVRRDAHLSQMFTLRWSTSIARSYTERARSKSRCASSKAAYLIHAPIALRFIRSRSSKCFRCCRR